MYHINIATSSEVNRPVNGVLVIHDLAIQVKVVMPQACDGWTSLFVITIHSKMCKTSRVLRNKLRDEPSCQILHFAVACWQFLSFMSKTRDLLQARKMLTNWTRMLFIICFSQHNSRENDKVQRLLTHVDYSRVPHNEWLDDDKSKTYEWNVKLNCQSFPRAGGC